MIVGNEGIDQDRRRFLGRMALARGYRTSLRVAVPTWIPGRFRVSIDGQSPGAAHGVDIDEGGNGAVVEQRLYQLIRQPRPIVDRLFEIEFLDAGVETFAFTFG